MQHSIANLLHWPSQCSRVRCLHLTVNLQWKVFTFTPKRSFGVKTLWNPAFGWISQLKVRIFPGRKAWKDALATQALRPELQKARPYGLAVESKKRKLQTTIHLRSRWIVVVDRNSWAVKPKSCLCCLRQQNNRINLLLSNWDAQCTSQNNVLASKWRLSSANLRLASITNAPSNHQCTLKSSMHPQIINAPCETTNC